MTDTITELHPLVQALIAEIPAKGPWPEPLRDLWLRAAAATFDLVYGKGEAIAIGPVVVSTLNLMDEQRGDLEQALKNRGPGEIGVLTENESTTVRDRLATWIDPQTEVKIVKEEAPVENKSHNVGGRPKTTGPHRPTHIPTNLQMALEAIDSKESKKATAGEILAFVRYTHWDGAPQNWTASLYDQVKAGKLARDGASFCRPPVEEKEETGDDFKNRMAQTIAAAPASVLESRAPENGVKFEYGGKSILLHKTEFRLAEALRRAMGKGHLDYTFLANAGTANQRRPSNNDKGWCREMLDVLAPKLERVGLELVHAQNFGYSLKAID